MQQWDRGFHYTEALMRLGPGISYFFSAQTKIGYWFHPKKSHKVVHKVVFTCTDYQRTVTDLKEQCKNHLSFYSCLKSTGSVYPSVAVANFPAVNTTDYLKQIERLRWNCDRQVVGYFGKLGENYHENVYLREWTKPGVNVEPIYIKMLISNCTVVGWSD